MTRARFDGLMLLLSGAIIFICLGAFLKGGVPASLTDFKALYYGGHCLLQHSDPYKESNLQKVYLEEVGGHPAEPPQARPVVTVFVNLPSIFTFVFPISLLPWGPAHQLWLILTAVSLILATLLTWDLGADDAPRISGGLLGILLATSASALFTGNAAGIVVGLAVIAVWCFLRERFVAMGVLCLATSLVIKPHDAGLIWLYFLLVGGVHRKRAIQTLMVAVALCLPGLILVWHVAPHWMTELRSNLSWFSARGNLNDPGPASVTGHDPDSIISLQTIASIFYDDPNIYNPISYLVSGVPVLLWLVTILKSKSSAAINYFGLAAIAALSLLLGYHRQHDAKILLLTFPAFAMLWAKRGVAGWLALGLTTAGVLLNGDLTSLVRMFMTENLLAHSSGLTGKILVILLGRPVPLIVLVTGVFYLWVYLRRGPVVDASGATEGSELALREAETSESRGA